LQKSHLYSLKVSAHVKISVECFENFGGANAPNAAPGCAPADYSKDLLDAKHLLQFEVRTVFDSKML